MSYTKQAYDREVAEIAAGRRESVDQYTASAYNSELVEERYEQERHAAALEEAAAAQAEAACQAADAAYQTLAMTQHAVQMQQAHQLEMEKAAAERNRVLALAEAQKLKFEQAAYAERMHAEKEREARELEERRIRTSPSYAAAKKTLELHKLQRWNQEGKELEALLKPAVSLWHNLKEAVRASDTEVSKQHAAAVAAAELAETQAASRRSLAIAEVKVALAKLQEDYRRNAEQRKACSTTLYPGTWFGDHAQRRRELEAARSDLSARITVSEEKLRRLAEPRVEARNYLPPQPKREERILAVCAAIGEGLTALEQALADWRDKEARSPEAIALLCSTALIDEPFDIDYNLCVTLDHARALGSEIRYPGLGAIAFGSHLVDVVSEIQALRRSLPGFCNGGEAPVGFEQLKWLRHAKLTGEMPNDFSAEHVSNSATILEGKRNGRHDQAGPVVGGIGSASDVVSQVNASARSGAIKMQPKTGAIRPTSAKATSASAASGCFDVYNQPNAIQHASAPAEPNRFFRKLWSGIKQVLGLFFGIGMCIMLIQKIIAFFSH